MTITTVIRAPAAGILRFGEPLSLSVLSGGEVTINGDPVEGLWAWLDPSLVPPVGSGLQTIVFTPDDALPPHHLTVAVRVLDNLVAPVLLRDLARVATALAASERFQHWVGSPDEFEARQHIFYLTTDRDLANKTEGWRCVVLSHGSAWQRDRRTYAGDWDTQPQVRAEFVTLIGHDDSDQTVFLTLLSELSGVVRDLEAQSALVINAHGPIGEDTPMRGPHGAGRVDWASFSLLFDLDEAQGDE